MQNISNYRDRKDDLSDTYSRVYDSLADQYEERAEQYHGSVEYNINRIAKWIPAGSRFLDVGCGVGTSLGIMSQHGFKACGIDISPRMVSYARKRNPSAEVTCGDIFHFTPGARFDCLGVHAFVHLFPSYELADIFALFRRLLQPRGFLGISTTVSRTSSEGWSRKGDYGGDHWRYRKFWTEDEFAAKVVDEGFEIIDSWNQLDAFGKNWMILLGRRKMDLDVWTDCPQI